MASSLSSLINYLLWTLLTNNTTDDISDNAFLIIESIHLWFISIPFSIVNHDNQVNHAFLMKRITRIKLQISQKQNHSYNFAPDNDAEFVQLLSFLQDKLI